MLQPVFARVAYRVASGNGPVCSAEVDDLVQDCFLKLEATREALQQATFEDESSALAYFRVLAANTARDYFRKVRAEKRGNATTICLDDQIKEIIGNGAATPETNLLIGKIDRILLGNRSHERTIFWLHYRQGFTAKEIADIRAFRLSAKGVESVLRRLTKTVRENVG